MKIKFVVVGKTTEPYIKEGIQKYADRIIHFNHFEMEEIPELKNTSSLSQIQVKAKEGQKILAKLLPTDTLILLDEKGKNHSSKAFASFINELLIRSTQRVVFVVGGAFGFSDEVYARAMNKISLSKMTFPHQLVRLIFLEQLYRGFTILRNLPYHHE